MPQIAQETIEQIAAANDIVEVISGYFPLKRAGSAYKATCPFHQEKTPSFTVNPQRQIFKCFGCGAGGGVFRFVMDYEQTDFVSAVRKLADRAGIHIVDQELTPEDSARLTMRRRLLAMHADATEFFHHQLVRMRSAQPARDYLKTRGITGAIAKEWQLGFAPDSWDALLNWLRERKYQKEEVLKSGLVTEREGGGIYDRFRNRVMFPICNDTGEVIAFSGRVLEADAKAAKYVNSSETILFTKGATLFGLNRSKRALINAKSAIVCEGQLDLITAYEAGVQNVVAPQGTAFTARQASILRRYVDEVILCFDSDAAGQKAAERSLASLIAESLAVRVARMPPGEDPDSLIRHQGADAFRERIAGARDFFEDQVSELSSAPDFNSAKGRSQAARKLAGWVGLLSDPVMREAVMNRVTMRLEISGPEFARLVRTAPKPDAGPSGDGAMKEGAVAKVVPLEPVLQLLVAVALHDPDGRAWLLEEEWRERLELESGAELLTRILEADLRLDDPASMQAFLTTLDAEDEARVTGILDEKAPAHGLAIARDCWNELERRQIRRRIEAIYAKLRTPDLSSEEAVLLQKEVLDRQKRLLDIAPPLPPPL